MVPLRTEQVDDYKFYGAMQDQNSGGFMVHVGRFKTDPNPLGGTSVYNARWRAPTLGRQEKQEWGVLEYQGRSQGGLHHVRQDCRTLSRGKLHVRLRESELKPAHHRDQLLCQEFLQRHHPDLERRPSLQQNIALESLRVICHRYYLSVSYS